MAYVSSSYTNNPSAPFGYWTCAPSSSLAPLKEVPPEKMTRGLDLCGQCVSYVKKVCPDLPATKNWKKGLPVKGNKAIVAGTVIATFDATNKFHGHAAIYVGQNAGGIQIFDQYVTPPSPTPVGPRTLRWGASGNANNGNNFYVVE